MNAISLYRIERWLFKKHVPFLPKIVQGLIFLLFNTKISPDSEIGKGTYFVCKGISTVLIPGTIIGDNCVLGLRFSTVRQFPYKDVPRLGNNVWIGPNVIIAGPVIVEDDVIVVGNSYLTKSVPKGAIVSGSPAKIIGWRKDLKYDINTNPKYLEGVMPFLKDLRNDVADFQTSADDNIGRQVIQIIARCLEVPAETIGTEARIEEIGEWDSLRNVLLIEQLEKAFHIAIPQEDLLDLVSVNAFIGEVNKCLRLTSADTFAEAPSETTETDAFALPEKFHSPLFEAIADKARGRGNHTAVIAEDRSISYAELLHNVRRTATYLHHLGLGAGDRIVLSGQKEVEFIYIYLASHLLGITNVITDAKSNDERLRFIEHATTPKYCFGYQSPEVPSILFKDMQIDGQEAYVPSSLPLTDQDICEIIFTTGTTGEAKGCCLSYSNVFASATNINGFIGNTSDDVEIVGLPICHSFGLGRIRCNLIKGATVVLLDGFTNVARFFDLIRRYHATGFGVVPAAWAYVTKMSGTKMSQFAPQIKYIEIGSAFMSLDTKKRMLAMFPDSKICMHYGCTEASRSTFMEFHDTLHLESIGKPVNDKVEIKIFDETGHEVPTGEKGEICVRGNMVMKHYLKSKHTENAFFGKFFRTGDLGYQDTDGFFYLIGREKEMINVGGKKVSPQEVEDAIRSLGVGDCICVATDDPNGLLGEVVKCYVLKGSTKLTFEEINNGLQGKLEVYKRPAVYAWIDQIPQTASGKKQRVNLK